MQVAERFLITSVKENIKNCFETPKIQNACG